MAINLMGANEYFRVHAKSEIWGEYSQAQREGAIENAKQDLSGELGRPMNEDEPPYKHGDRVREDRAVYEQALFILEQIGIVRGKSSPVPSLTAVTDEPETRVSRTHGKWAPKALRWLGYSGAIATN